MKASCPAHLIIGHQDETASFANSLLKKNLCKENCSSCIICKKIDNKTHENIIWLEPDKAYTKTDLDIIFEKSSFALEENEKFFFIIEQAELLNCASANSLLKIIEEPPTGYSFLFLTSRGQDILPTIKSRCITKELLSNQATQNHALFDILISEQIDAIRFIEILDKTAISEKESIILLEQLIIYWVNKLKNQLTNNQDCSNAQLQINIFSKALTKPPMSGSSKVFWKNIAIQLSK